MSEDRKTEFNCSAEMNVDFGRSFDDMSIKELEAVINWYADHVGGHEHFTASFRPYVEARKRGYPVTWKHAWQQGTYGKRAA